MCGDSTRPEYVSRLMGDERAVLFATDPPYAVGYSGGSHPATRANRAKANRDKDWSKVYHEAGRTTFDNEEAAAMAGDLSIWPFTDRHRTRDRAQRSLVLLARIGQAGDARRRLERSRGFQPSTSHLVQDRPVLTYSVYMWAHEPCLFGWIRARNRRRPQVWYPGTIWQAPTPRSRAANILRRSRTGSLRFRWSCTLAPATFVTSRSAAADRNCRG